MAAAVRVGLISDTHGLLRPEVAAFLQGSDRIIHCGDVCDPAVIRQLACIAPVSAVRGNNDQGAWAEALPESEMNRIGQILTFVIHDIAMLDIDPAALGVSVVLAGHSHKPSVVRRDGVIYLNPGSAGPRRFKLPISAAELIIDSGTVRPRIVEFPDC